MYDGTHVGRRTSTDNLYMLSIYHYKTRRHASLPPEIRQHRCQLGRYTLTAELRIDKPRTASKSSTTHE